jgi:hypothetical protein
VLGFQARSGPRAVRRPAKWWETLPEGYQLWRIRQRSVGYTLAVDWRDPAGPVVDSVWPAPAKGSTEWQRQEMDRTSRLLVGQPFLAVMARCYLVTRLW